MSGRFKIIVCRGPECGDRNDSRTVHAAFDRELHSRGLTGAVELGWHSCFGRCSQGPNVLIAELAGAPAGAERRFAFAALPGPRTGRSALYNGCSPDDVPELVGQHIVKGSLVRRLIHPVAPSGRAATGGDRDPTPRPAEPDRGNDGDG